MTSSYRLAAVCVAMVFATGAARGQLTVVSSSPEHGSINVPLEATFALVFSAPLDTTARFPSSQDFYVAARVYPDPGDPTAIALSPDRATLTITLALQPETQYWLVVRRAQSVTGALLEGPFVASFTTGSALPAGAVTGRLSGTDALRAEAFLMPPEDLFGEEGDAVSGYARVSSDGTYSIDFVPDGSYYAIATVDTDEDGSPDAGEPVAVLDADRNRIADQIEVTGGSTVSGVDLALEPYVTRTAGWLASAVRAEAERRLPGSVHVGTFAGEVGVDGTAAAWLHVYRSEEGATDVTLAVLGSWVLEGDFGEEGPQFPGDPLPEVWIDSDGILAITEAEGGAEFRAMYPETFILAILAAEAQPIGFRTRRDLTVTASGVADPYMRPAIPGGRLGRVPQVPVGPGTYAPKTSSSAAVWTIAYLVEGAFSMWLIDAETGVILANPGRPDVASESLSPAREAALAWRPDAVPVMMGPAGPEGVAIDGTSPYWNWAWVSAADGAVRGFLVSGGMVLNEEDGRAEDLWSTEALPDGWIDSDVVMAIAEGQAGAFRSQHQEVVVVTILSRGLQPSDPSRTIWLAGYHSNADGENLHVFLDALTGAVITARDRQDPLPGTETLGEPYPNPATNEAVLTVSSARFEEIVVELYDALGRRVLQSASRGIGERAVRLDTSRLASGAYYARIAGGRQGRPLTVVR